MSKNEYPKRLKRSESFLGVHFDFHADEDCTRIGATLTSEMIENIIARVAPDYIQCDGKGHPGYSSYPTKIGNPAPGFVCDPLPIWRRVTARNGVALYVHYSGVIDKKAISVYPKWARIDENGDMDKSCASTFGPYVDELLIPQLKELNDDYGIDGVWVDGECWALSHDYCDEAVKAFREKTGIDIIPKKPDDPYFYEFSEFNREAFRSYLRYYVNEMHKHNPDFEVASNWAFSSLMPEPVSADVDFISGDLPRQNSVYEARFEGRCLRQQGKPWDLMSWGFNSEYNDACPNNKSALQLMQEAAIVMALGGGFQVYYKQRRDGSIYEFNMDIMSKVARFCRERQSVTHKAQSIPQIALILCTDALYRKSPRLFGPWGKDMIPFKGVLQSLLDAQNAVDILMEYQLEERLGKYPLAVIPEWDSLSPELKGNMSAYVQNGGNLIVIGPNAVKQFSHELKIESLEVNNKRINLWLGNEGQIAGFRTESAIVKLGEGANVFGKLYGENYIAGDSSPAASIAEYGKGKIAGVYFNFGESYINGVTVTARRFLNGLVRVLFPDPIVEVTGSQYVDVCVNSINGKLTVNLVNTAGPHADEKVYVYDDIPSVGPLHLKIKYGSRPNRVVLVPADTEIKYAYVNGFISCTIPVLEVHAIVVVE